MPHTDKSSYLADVALANEAADAYYRSDRIVIDDATYDQLVRALAATEALHPDWTSPDSPTGKVGASGGDVAHSEKMLSLDNVFDAETLAAFTVLATTRLAASGHSDATWVIEPKLDGLALSARYTEGRLVVLATRGDGESGEDVTHAAPAIDGLPARLTSPVTLEVRGEVVLTHAQLEEGNRIRLAAGEAPFANARNGAAGTLRARGRSYTIPMTFHAYGAAGENLPASHTALLAHLSDLGVRTTAQAPGGAVTATSPEAIWAAVDALRAGRADLGIDIDGAVIKLDTQAHRDVLGSTARAPRWAIAYKYPADTALSVLREVVWQVGRTGAITPRATIDPVSVGGTTITHATLHNADDIARKGFQIGDTVTVHRAGEVIPRLQAPLIDRRDGTQTPIALPTSCPRCGDDIDKSQARWRCVRGRDCGNAEAIRYAASRDALDIEGLGDTLARQLVERGLASDIGDVFTLTKADLMTCERIGEQSADKILANINAARTRPLARIYTALGMRETGRTICRRLAAAFGSFDALAAASIEDLCLVPGIGPDTAEVIAAEIAAVAPIAAKLTAAGVTLTHAPVSSAPPAAADSPLAGKRVCITGTIPGLSRTQAAEAAEALGAVATGSVSKSVDVLIYGDAAGSKLDKARSLGVPLMTAEQFLALLTPVA